MAIFTRQKVFFEQKVVFIFNFYHKKVPEKHSAELKIRNKNLMICPNNQCQMKMNSQQKLDKMEDDIKNYNQYI